MRLTVPLLAISLGLTACASQPTIYAPAAAGSGVGYTDMKIETNRFRVTFDGATDAPRTRVESLALRRAAEITLQEGYDWFEVVHRRTDALGASGGRGTSVGVSASGGSRGHTGVGVGIGIDLTPDRTRYATDMEILLGKGARPDRPDAYLARSILETAID